MMALPSIGRRSCEPRSDGAASARSAHEISFSRRDLGSAVGEVSFVRRCLLHHAVVLISLLAFLDPCFVRTNVF